MRSAHCWTLQARLALQHVAWCYLAFRLLPFSRANFPKGKVSKAILATSQFCTVNPLMDSCAYCTTSLPLDHCVLSPSQANDTALTASGCSCIRVSRVTEQRGVSLVGCEWNRCSASALTNMGSLTGRAIIKGLELAR